eukprot:1247148-Prymnesium_polylepis.2
MGRGEGSSLARAPVERQFTTCLGRHNPAEARKGRGGGGEASPPPTWLHRPHTILLPRAGNASVRPWARDRAVASGKHRRLRHASVRPKKAPLR